MHASNYHGAICTKIRQLYATALTEKQNMVWKFVIHMFTKSMKVWHKLLDNIMTTSFYHFLNRSTHFEQEIFTVTVSDEGWETTTYYQLFYL